MISSGAVFDGTRSESIVRGLEMDNEFTGYIDCGIKKVGNNRWDSGIMRNEIKKRELFGGGQPAVIEAAAACQGNTGRTTSRIPPFIEQEALS